MLVLLGEVHHLIDLGLCDFIGEDTAHADTLLVDVQHHPCRLIGIHLEKGLQHMDDKFHRSVVVVEQQHFILAGLLRFGPRARGKAYAGTAPIVAIAIGA